jgi:hypothetical protein
MIAWSIWDSIGSQVVGETRAAGAAVDAGKEILNKIEAATGVPELNDPTFISFIAFLSAVAIIFIPSRHFLPMSSRAKLSPSVSFSL